MDDEVNNLPDLPGFIWRHIEATDAAAIAALAQACAAQDGAASASRVVDYGAAIGRGETSNGSAIAAESGDGLLVALGWTAMADGPSEYRVVLEGRVHPAYRRNGLGAVVLRWSEERGRERLDPLPHDRRRVLRIDSPGVTPDAASLYQRHGFRLHFAEDVMERRLDATLPSIPLPPTVKLAPWNDETLAHFYSAYIGSFRERPGFPGWSEDEWVDWVSADDDFRPDASYVATYRGQPAGFIVTGVGSLTQSDEDRAGWITQVGTISEWRGRGLGAALIAHVMQQFRAESLHKVSLFVNSNNPTASTLYHRLGFETVARRTIFQKPVD